MINFVFEDLKENRNFVNNWVLNNTGSNRFTVAPIYNRMNIFQHIKRDEIHILNSYSFENKPKNYIIPIGGNNNPNHWAGGDYWNPEDGDYTPSFFEFFNEDYLNDLRNRNAFFIIDSSFEGYHDDKIFEFFHQECEKYNIDPRQMIFVSGNSIVEERYKIWLSFNPKEKKMNPLPYSHFENDVYLTCKEMGPKIPTFEYQMKYKEEHINDIKLFSNLNKKPREHRVWFYSLLMTNDLLKDGLVSMNMIMGGRGGRKFCGMTMDNKLVKEIIKTLPSLIYNTGNDVYDPNFYITRINCPVTLDSWVSVVSEARFEDEEGTIFLSEKIFKPITCHHPFIIMGNRNSLVEMKKLGYETFSNFIDESYDGETNLKRMTSIIDSIKEIKKIKNKLSWYKDMEKILKHNYEVLRYNVMEKPPYTFKKIQEIYYNTVKKDLI